MRTLLVRDAPGGLFDDRSDSLRLRDIDGVTSGLVFLRLAGREQAMVGLSLLEAQGSVRRALQLLEAATSTSWFFGLLGRLQAIQSHAEVQGRNGG